MAHDTSPKTRKRKLPGCERTKDTMQEELSSPKETVITYVEFYSGVGGWTMALEQALDRLTPSMASSTRTSVDGAAIPLLSPKAYRLQRLAALDHSDLCVKVFSHNFDTQKAQQKSFSIERMPLRQLEDWSADVWVMSPPCQPHTRQHNSVRHDHGEAQPLQRSKDLDDPRSKSFLKICEWLEGTSGDRLRDECLPSLIFLENVVGFESSSSFQRWTSALVSRGYRFGHFHLTPTQVRLPNDRPRYYCVAIHRSFGRVFRRKSHPTPGMEDDSLTERLWSYLDNEGKYGNTGKHSPKIWTSISELMVSPEHQGDESVVPLSAFLGDPKETEEHNALLALPDKVWKHKSAWCFDIVCPTDRRSSCFTHSYGRYIKGTGSILYDTDKNCGAAPKLLPPEEREFSDSWREGIDSSKLRYFSGKELARLFGFSKEFSFPKDISAKQQWKLMGNSLNVGIASKLVELGFRLRYGCSSESLEDHDENNNEIDTRKYTT